MKSKNQHRVFWLIGFLLATRAPAHADELTDFKAGNKVKVASATVSVAGGLHSSSGSSVLAKTTGSFDFQIRAADIGVDLPVLLHLHGTALANSRLQLDFDDTFATPIALGGGYTVSRIAGHVYLHALPVHGDTVQTVGNVRLVVSAPSRATAYTNFGAVSVDITKFDLLGGVPQPSLSRLADAGTGLICSSPTVPTYRMLTATLAGPATGTGALVEVGSEAPASVTSAPGVVVHQGRNSTLVRTRITPRFTGTVRVTAKAGGVSRSLDIFVHPPADCAR